MTRGRWVVFLMYAVQSITACTSLKSYPICFFDTDTAQIETARANWKTVAARLQTAIRPMVGRFGDVEVASSTTFVIKADEKTHDELRAAWPLLACYADTSGSEGARLLDICRKYIRALVAANDNPGNVSRAVVRPQCQTFGLDKK